jgi:serine/threonine-protein kinase
MVRCEEVEQSARTSIPPAPHIVGRYAMYGEIAAGGMATVHYGRLLGPVGFSRTVAIKRLHPHYARDPEFVAMFLDEARLAARIRHPNVVQTLDVVAREGELFLVMDYVQGESLSRLVRAARDRNEPLPLGIVSAIVCGALQGLHAAHEATNERGEPLSIVHRDVSPQNVLVGADGAPRVLDFGVAKAAGRIHTTREGQLKGKLAYMSTEQLRSAPVDRRTDVYAAGVVLWEALTLKRLFAGESEGAVITSVLERHVPPPSSLVPDLPPGLDAVVLKALERDPAKRFDTAQQMAFAIEACVPSSSSMHVAEWIARIAGEVLALRARSVAQIEIDSGDGKRQPLPSERPATVTPSGVRPLSGLTPARLPSDVPTLSHVSISVSTTALHARFAPKLRRPGVVFGAFGLATAAVVAAVLGSMASRANRSPPPVSAAAAIATVTAPPAAQAPPVAAPAPAPPSTQETTAAPAPLPRTASAPAASKPQVAHSRTAKPAPAAASQPTCVVRSFVDEAGIKHYTKDCQ